MSAISKVYRVSKGVFSYGLSVLMELVILYSLMPIIILTFEELLIVFAVTIICALGLSYVIYSLSGYIESKLILKHKVESPLLATIIVAPIYYIAVAISLEAILPLVPETISFIELTILLLLIPILILLIIVYILSS